MKKVSKKSLLFYSFICVNILFIFLQIYKQSNFVKLSFEKQRIEKEKEQLLQKKDSITQQLYILKNPANIKEFATRNLKMQKVKLNQIKNFTDYE